ncbi:FecR domain-containing protein [uncultured Chitinophaga sp.]|jgi:Fe2+-dicitrate sensor, membrane component|uniref:FecR domain-containing protein n=1 Tax=uncultured Chitinophaga sp. TaxID=339340 RepID=UPI0026058EF3|nr:FecR domain-containing protein [uncultured Chitinophaga sp.]
MSYDLDHIETLIARDIDKSLSPEEKKTLQSWLDEDSANREYYDALKSTWSLTATADADFVPATEKNWEVFRQHITATGKRSFLHTYRNALRVAATVILLCGAATAWFVFFRQPEVAVYTQSREKRTVTLPDGSKVFLNQQSSLRYAAGFSGRERAVHLEGEAFFEVTHQTDKPFVVYTQHTQTQVLGTSFDVKSYNPAEVEVAVVTGKVAFSDRKKAQRLVLSSGNRGVLQSASTLKQLPIEDPNFMAWKENRLSFQDTRISDVINSLEAYFDVQIVLKDQEAGRLRYNGTFDPEQLNSLDSVLEVICPTVNLRWSREGQDGKYVLVPAQ